jgi:calcineurin-like phosphoesterase family protein
MEIFLTSDTHFSHAGVTQFLNYDGTKLRPWDNPEDMDEYMVKVWNDTVGKKDKVYHLGDVIINRRAFSLLDRLNGEKVLIKGNHDIFRPEEYLRYFKDLRGYHVLDKFLMSHIPIHPDSLERFRGNIHGHLHSNLVKLNDVPDLRYFNVCVEHTEFKPISFETVKKRYEERKA